MAHSSIDASEWAEKLGISTEAVELYSSSEVVDLHVDSFIWTRIFGYDLNKQHASRWSNRFFWGQVDIPRLQRARIGSAIWVVTTNPLRASTERQTAFFDNLRQLQEILSSADGVRIVRNHAEYLAARNEAKHAAFIGIQGGNALDHQPETLARLPDDLIVRVTLVHLTSSRLGETSSPGRQLRLAKDPAHHGLGSRGHAFIEALNHKKIFVDLAHISPRGFWQAHAIHDASQPLLVTHTGVSGVYSHWRNLDDQQLRAIADTGGTVGIMYHMPFLGPRSARLGAATIVDHLAHVIETVGEDHASLGSDWDGAIVTPADMPTCLELPRLVQHMLDREWSPERIQKILGLNFLRTLKELRG